MQAAVVAEAREAPPPPPPARAGVASADPVGPQDWEELLEANIKAGYSASNTAHLNTIQNTSKNLEEILEQQARAAPSPSTAVTRRHSKSEKGVGRGEGGREGVGWGRGRAQLSCRLPDTTNLVASDFAVLVSSDSQCL